MTDFYDIKLNLFCHLNPQTAILKNHVVKKIGMECLTPFRREINGFSEELFSAGSKFKNGDTLLARITPCLENGKTAFVNILGGDEVAFGSTEFIILREKQGVSDALFLYYFAISSDFRKRAISLMSGTSGRQRVDAKILGEEVFSLPPLDVQKRIAGILGALDDRIDVLRRENVVLEQMAQAVFQSWFVDFDIVRAKAAGTPESEVCEKYHITPELYALFPSALTPDNLPLGWEKKAVKDVLTLNYGKALKETDRISGNIPVYGANGQIGTHNKSLVSGPGIVVGRKGTVGTVIWTDYDFYPIDTSFYVTSLFQEQSLHFLHQMLCSVNLPSLSGDSAVPGLNREAAYNQIFICPQEEILKNFENAVTIFYQKRKTNTEQIRALSATRDALLPKLMNGEIEV